MDIWLGLSNDAQWTLITSKSLNTTSLAASAPSAPSGARNSSPLCVREKNIRLQSRVPLWLASYIRFHGIQLLWGWQHWRLWQKSQLGGRWRRVSKVRELSENEVSAVKNGARLASRNFVGQRGRLETHAKLCPATQAPSGIVDSGAD